MIRCRKTIIYSIIAAMISALFAVPSAFADGDTAASVVLGEDIESDGMPALNEALDDTAVSVVLGENIESDGMPALNEALDDTAASVVLGENIESDGMLTLYEGLGDASTEYTQIEGEPCHTVPNTSKYLYFKISSSYMSTSESTVKMKIRYFDNTDEKITVQYHKQGGRGGAYWWESFEIPRRNTNEWVDTTVYIFNANWPGMQQNQRGVSFRLGTKSSDAPAYINMVEITKNAAAEDGSVSVLSSGNETVMPDDMLTVFSSVAADEISWLRGEIQDGVYFVCDGDSESYRVTWDDEDKYIRALVTNGDGGFVSDCGEKIGGMTLSTRTSDDLSPDAVMTTPPENVFKINGNDKEFILLDTRNNDKAKFFVMAKDFYGEQPFDSAADTTGGQGSIAKYNKFDSNQETNIAYWLNNVFPNETETLPEEILNYIDWDYIWKTEPNKVGLSAYTTKAGIALISAWEFDKYMGKFGYRDSLTKDNTAWYTRTAYAGSSWTSSMLIGAKLNVGGTVYDGRLVNGNGERSSYIRPVFNIGKEFFSNVRLDVSSLGENVKAAMREVYDTDELLGIYTKTELIEKLGFPRDGKITIDSVTDLSANELSSLDGTENVCVNYTIKNNSDDEKNYFAAAAVYNSEGEILAINGENVFMNAKSEAPGNQLLLENINTEKNASYIKVFLYGGVTGGKNEADCASFGDVRPSREPQDTEKDYIRFDPDTSVLKVYGKLTESDTEEFNDNVVLRVLKPDKKESDLENSAFNSVVYYADECVVNNNSYYFEFKVNSVKGKHEVLITLPGGRMIGGNTFYYASSDDFEEVRSKLSGIKTQSEMIDFCKENSEMLNLAVDEYDAVTNNEVKETLLKKTAAALLNSAPYAGLSEFEQSYKRELVSVLTAWQNDSAAAVDNMTKYEEYFPAASEAFYKNWFKKLSYSEKQAVMKLLRFEEISSYKIYEEEFYKAGTVYKLNNASNWAEANQILIDIQSKCSDSALSAYYALGNAHSNVDKLITGMNFKNWSELSRAISTAISGQNGGKGSGGKGTSGSGSSGGSGMAIASATGSVNRFVPATKDDGIFNDLDQAAWAKEYIVALYNDGVVSKNEEGRFYPQDNVKREEFIKMLVIRCGKLNEGAVCSFNDVSSGDWFYKYVSSAFVNGIIKGDDNGEFGTGQNMTREDAAVMLCRVLGLDESDAAAKFKDYESISDYAMGSVGALTQIGIISGNEKNEFNPKGFLTRAEAAKILYFAVRAEHAS